MSMKFLLLILAVILVGCSNYVQEGYTSGTVTIENSESKKYEFEVEVPLTRDGFLQGLMFRESFEMNRGMLFMFADSAERTFWMKDTLIPLDMLFIDDNFVIRRIHHAIPCEELPCASYGSGVPVMFVLEINGGLTNELNIKEGGAVKIDVAER